MLLRYPSVIAVPARKLARKVVDIGNCSGSDVEKFKMLVGNASEVRIRGRKSGSGSVRRLRLMVNWDPRMPTTGLPDGCAVA